MFGKSNANGNKHDVDVSVTEFVTSRKAYIVIGYKQQDGSIAYEKATGRDFNETKVRLFHKDREVLRTSGRPSNVWCEADRQDEVLALRDELGRSPCVMLGDYNGGLVVDIKNVVSYHVEEGEEVPERFRTTHNNCDMSNYVWADNGVNVMEGE